jgi:hypothetical protein
MKATILGKNKYYLIQSDTPIPNEIKNLLLKGDIKYDHYSTGTYYYKIIQ